MPPRRSVRRNSGTGIPGYKKGDTVEFKTNGLVSKGKIIRKSPRGSATSPLWIVAPYDRRRKNEEVPEKAIARLIQNEAAPKSKRLARSSTGGTASSYSDESMEDAPQASATRRSTRGSGTGTGSSEELSESSKKRKSDESDNTANNNKSRKVTFQDGKKDAVAAAKKKRVVKKKPLSRGSGNINTRSTRANGGDLMSELPPATKPSKMNKAAAAPKPKKNENVKVIKMLTGTLYLYRGEIRRAEFVRSKY